jgi:hypothetical protein
MPAMANGFMRHSESVSVSRALPDSIIWGAGNLGSPAPCRTPVKILLKKGIWGKRGSGKGFPMSRRRRTGFCRRFTPHSWAAQHSGLAGDDNSRGWSGRFDGFGRQCQQPTTAGTRRIPREPAPPTPIAPPFPPKGGVSLRSIFRRSGRRFAAGNAANRAHVRTSSPTRPAAAPAVRRALERCRGIAP